MNPLLRKFRALMDHLRPRARCDIGCEVVNGAGDWGSDANAPPEIIVPDGGRLAGRKRERPGVEMFALGGRSGGEQLTHRGPIRQRPATKTPRGSGREDDFRHARPRQQGRTEIINGRLLIMGKELLAAGGTSSINRERVPPASLAPTWTPLASAQPVAQIFFQYT